MELTSNQMYHLVERMPEFDHSYETISQKGYSADYNVALAIPVGKKTTHGLHSIVTVTFVIYSI